jgi:hypothetical protein
MLSFLKEKKMKKMIFVLMLMTMLSIIFWSCTEENTSEPENKAPTCVITSPADSAKIDKGNDITVSVDADDEDGYISEVRFSLNNQPYGGDEAFPYSFTFLNADLEFGNCIIGVTAIDNKGKETKKSILIDILPVLPVNFAVLQNNDTTLKLGMELFRHRSGEFHY